MKFRVPSGLLVAICICSAVYAEAGSIPSHMTALAASRAKSSDIKKTEDDKKVVDGGKAGDDKKVNDEKKTAGVKKARGVRKVSATHPFYRTALSDLRTARWMIYHHPTNWQPTVNEGVAVTRIDAAIAAIVRASIDDGKGPNDRPKGAKRKDSPVRLDMALHYLKKARTNISRDGDKNLAQGLQLRAYEQIDGAIIAVRKTLRS